MLDIVLMTCKIKEQKKSVHTLKSRILQHCERSIRYSLFIDLNEKDNCGGTAFLYECLFQWTQRCCSNEFFNNSDKNINLNSRDKYG